MKDKVLTITYINHLLNLRWLIIFSGFYYLGVYIIFGEEFLYSFPLIHIWVLVQLLITLMMHVRYYVENFRHSFVVETKQIINTTKDIKYNNTEILKIIIHKNIMYPIFPFQTYKYCKVILKNGNSFILTSLLHYDIDNYLKENLKGVLFDKDESFFSNILS